MSSIMLFMRHSVTVSVNVLLVLGCMQLLNGASLNAAAKSNYEKPSVLKASKILPADLVTGPHHRLDDKVRNDGYMNTYTLHSTFG